jgi:hypothetical protein
MYCPRCGRQPVSDALRFCSYCGFKLGVVKASLADDDEGSAIDHFAVQVVAKERQRDINSGVILMFVGSLLAALLAGRGGLGLGREGGALLLAAWFSATMLFSRPILKLIYKLLTGEEPPAESFSVSQRRMILGSILMFVSTVLLAITSVSVFGRMRTPEFFFGLATAFVFLLVISKHLVRGLRYLVGTDTDAMLSQANAAVSLGDTVANPPLGVAQDTPVSLFAAQRVDTAEILTPASVTEHTTNLLENK